MRCVQIDPAHESTYEANFKAFVKDLAAVHDTICGLLECDSPGKQKKTFMVFHPSWAYFAREFGLRQLAIEIEGKEPGPRQLETVFKLARENAIHSIFVQPQFSRRSAQAMAQLNAQVLVADDLDTIGPETFFTLQGRSQGDKTPWKTPLPLFTFPISGFHMEMTRC